MENKTDMVDTLINQKKLTPLAQEYIDWANGQLGVLFNEENDADNNIFLSVVMRTQGTRPAELAEALLCLSAQTDSDFEIILVGHKVAHQHKIILEKIIESQPYALRTKIKYTPIEEGNRSRPLNVGFQKSKGSYIAILDDDDLVCDNWVESFKNQAKQTPGYIIRSYAVTQQWQRGEQMGSLCAKSEPNPQYCAPFDYIFQLRENRSPTMTLAFPGLLARQSNIRFDETLDTNEDWDYLMRMSFLAGVVDTDQVTCVYRLWCNANSSWTVHNEDEWRKNHKIIEKRLAAWPILLPIGASRQLVTLYDDARAYTEEKASKAEGHGFLYWTSNKEYSNDARIMAHNENEKNYFFYSFRGLAEKDIEGRSWLRFDVTEQGMICLKNFTARLRNTSGEWVVVSHKESRCNGYCAKDVMVFVASDPQVFVKVPENFHIDEIYLEGELSPVEDWALQIREDIGWRSRLFFEKEKEKWAQCEEVPNKAHWPEFSYCWDIPQTNPNPITHLRFDPTEWGGLLIKELKANLIDANGDKFPILLSSWQAVNGGPIFGGFLFPNQSPQLYLKLSSSDVHATSIEISGKVEPSVPTNLLNQLYTPFNPAVLYIDYGTGFLPKNFIQLSEDVQSGFIKYQVSFLREKVPVKLRFDPAERTGFILEDIEITLLCDNGVPISLDTSCCLGNGLYWQKSWVFLQSDPQLILPMPSGVSVVGLIVSGKLTMPVPNAVIQEITKPGLISRLKKKLKISNAKNR